MKKNITLKELYTKYQKEDVFDKYSRIIRNWKNYDNITRSKMIAAIIEEYSNYNNIIDICTLKELKYLEKIINQDEDINNLKEYNFERDNLIDKMLILPETQTIPSELEENIKLKIKNYHKKDVTDKDKINEILIGILKIYGELPGTILIDIAKPLLTCSPQTLAEHIKNNKVFNYYAMPTEKNIGFSEEKILTFIYTDYYDYIDDLDEQRMNNAIAYDLEINLEKQRKLYKNTFYYDFDISNKKIANMVNLIKENLPHQYRYFIKDIQLCTLLYEEPSYTINMINRSILFFKIFEEKKDFEEIAVEKIINTAIQEIPSGALNGLTPKEYQVKIKILEEKERKKEENYKKQTTACISKKDADLFYKLYLALLEYTNNKYHINKKLKKIYKKQNINPAELINIIDKLWESPTLIIDDFIKDNQYKFNQEELSIIEKFKLGQRDIFFLANYEEEYTAILSKEEKIYMIKGIRDNIDNIINYKDLPKPIITTLLPFKENIIYDGIINEFPIQLGENFNKMIEVNLNKNIKYYHL